MPSSTSGSDARRPAARAAAVLIVGCVVIAAFSEIVVRVGFDRVSKIQRRMDNEYRGALATRDRTAPHSVLFLGNSLLDEGVQFESLRERLAPEWDARRFVVEQTFYNDWYYGMRRLLHEGAHPDVVVIMLTPRQWIRDDTRGDYSAQYLMTVPDAATATRALHMHPTQGSSFVLASVSKFWGARAEIRNFILGRTMPDLVQLMSYSSVVDPTIVGDDTVERIAADRFEQCKALAEQYGVRVVALVPPVLHAPDGSSGLIRAGQRAGLPVFAPVASGAYPAGFYRDSGFHLNAAGAREFTNVLALYLPQHLNQLSVSASRFPLPSRSGS